MARLFRRTARGIEARFTTDEVALLRTLADDLIDTVQSPSTDVGIGAGIDAGVARLFPNGYRDDPDAAAELRRLTEDDLRAGKADAAVVVVASIGERVVLDEETAGCWLGALNDLRLLLGTRLGVTEEEPCDDEVYDWLTWLQDGLVHAMAGL